MNSLKGLYLLPYKRIVVGTMEVWRQLQVKACSTRAILGRNGMLTYAQTSGSRKSIFTNAYAVIIQSTMFRNTQTSCSKRNTAPSYQPPAQFLCPGKNSTNTYPAVFMSLFSASAYTGQAPPTTPCQAQSICYPVLQKRPANTAAL